MSCLLIKCCKYFVFCSSTSAVFTAVLIMSSMIPLTIPGADPGFQVRRDALKKIAPSGGRREHFWGISCEKSRFYAKKHIFSNFRGGARAGCAPLDPPLYTVIRHRWNCQELKHRIFRSAIALSSALIHVLGHFQRTTCSQIYFRFSSYLLRKPHLFVILTAIGWFIISIQSDLFWHRCLERQAFGTPRIYTLSPSKSIKGSNYGEFLKDKNVLLCTRLSKYLRIWKVCLHSNMYA